VALVDTRGEGFDVAACIYYLSGQSDRKSILATRKEADPMSMHFPRRGRAAALVAAASLVALAGCSTSGDSASPAGSASAGPATVKTLRLGFFPNLTHAPALVGLQDGYFRNALKDLGVTVTPTAFNAGPDAVTALFGDSLDISYIGPNPTINAYAESGGDAIRVISGAASGGAALVVRDGIRTAADLKGRSIATPQLGNTQDVALRAWLGDQGLATDAQGGGDVSILPQSNAEGLTAFSTGRIDGAWLPEPWVSEYEKAGAKELVDEAGLWPDGNFVTTNIVVRTEFLEQHPDVVKAFLIGHLRALDEIRKKPTDAAEAANASLRSLTGSRLDDDILTSAFKHVEFTADPLPATLERSAADAVKVGLLDQSKIDAAGGLPGRLYDLGLLDEALTAAGEPTVATP
jgi:sulfonate transport system substrate-binding protein